MSLPLMNVTPKVIDDLYRFLAEPTSRKPATVLRFHTVLRAAFAQAVRWRWVDRNPGYRSTPRAPGLMRLDVCWVLVEADRQTLTSLHEATTWDVNGPGPHESQGVELAATRGRDAVLVDGSSASGGVLQAPSDFSFWHRLPT